MERKKAIGYGRQNTSKQLVNLLLEQELVRTRLTIKMDNYYVP